MEGFSSCAGKWDLRDGRQRGAKSASAFAGTSGIQRQRVSRRCAEPRLSFIQRRLAGTRRKRKSLARRSILPGKRSSAVTRSQMAATSQCQIASATKHLQGETELSFGGKALSAARTA